MFLCGRTGTVFGPGLVAFEFFLGTEDGVDLLWGFTGIVRLVMRINPFATHSDRMVRRGIPNDLNVHVNHLNRALKETTGKTTSGHIKERILQESKILLKQSQWNISEIGYSLGFSEATHFSNFFKKHTEVSPSQFRNV